MRVLFLCALLLSGCASADPVPTSSCPPISGAVMPDGIVSPPPVSPSVEPAVPLTNCIEQALLQIAARLPDERTSERTRAKAAYDYVIENTWFGPPVGLTVWQIRGEAKPPDYLENRALSPLLFGIGACEDYAAALTLLLRQLGLSARYVPGLTVSVEGAFVDHAWVVVQIDDRWFHLDPQLEDNVMRGRQLTYRYFLKSDQAMLADHRWGENLIACAGFTAEQIEQVRALWSPPACPCDAPAEPPRAITKCVCPDRAALERALTEETAQYERRHGPLALPRIDTITPPVFERAGYGNPAY